MNKRTIKFCCLIVRKIRSFEDIWSRVCGGKSGGNARLKPQSLVPQWFRSRVRKKYGLKAARRAPQFSKR